MLQYKEVAQKIANSKRIIILSHFNPDPDAYGSSLGLWHVLRSLGKEVMCLNQTAKAPESLKFIPGISEIRSEFPVEYLSYDLMIACDCANIDRLGDKFAEIAGKFENLVNIDHHPNPLFGKFNIVDTKACATSELVYYLLVEMGCKVPAEAATCLLAGIYGDTISFRNANSRAESFAVAGKLVEAGGDAYLISRRLFGSKPLNVVRFQAAALQNIEFHSDNRLGIVCFTDADYTKYGVSSDDTESLKNLILEIEGVLISAVIRQQDEIFRVSLRSADQRLDVSLVAQKFGGGGHKMAAAFRWKKDLAQLKAAIIPELKLAISNIGL